MKPDIADRLAEAGDFYALTRSVLALCEPFGPVHSFRVVHNRGASRVACLVELESAKQQPALARALGTRVVGGAVCLDVAVRKDFGGAARSLPAASGAAPQPGTASSLHTHSPPFVRM